MFTDVADSTRLKQPGALGAAAYATIARAHDALLARIVASIPGAEILKDVGDGFLAVFPTASDAVRAALRFQHALHTDPAFTPPGSPFRVRIGIHQGEVSVLDLDVHGKPKLVGPAADMTARIQSLALPGQILVSRAAFNDARQYVREHPACEDPTAACPALRWDAHGHYRFKGIDDPQEVLEVGALGLSPCKAPPNTESARYVGSPDDEAVRGWRPAVGQFIPGRPTWVLERSLGEGGFGEVWLAHQSKTKERRVFKFCFDPDRLRSFRREITLFRLLREALGSRPDIATLHDFRLDNPPFYLESEYSELGDLNTWSASQGGIDKVALPERLRIVTHVAEAVAAAHSVGILHKDLKPSNILMFQTEGGSGGGGVRPRLADFGIGILTDRTQLQGHAITAAGFSLGQLTDNSSSRTGTRLYSPPEADIGKPFTVQGDVYALGVLLYQMAIGDLTRPLATGWESDVSDEMIRETISAATMGDLARRIATAAEFARIVSTNDERRAERVRTITVARREKTRKRILRLATAATLALAVIAVLATLAFKRERSLAASERAARLAADDATAKAIASTKAAEASKEEETKARKRAETTAKFVTTALQAGDAQNTGGGQEMTILAAMDNAIKDIDSGRFKNDPETEAALRATIATILQNNGRLADAEPLCAQALETWQRLFPGDHEAVAMALNNLAALREELGHASDAEPLFVKALEMSRRLFKGDHEAVAMGLNNLAFVRQSLGRAAEAEPLYIEALEIQQRLFKGDHEAVANGLNNLAGVRLELGRAAEAGPLFFQALAMWQRLHPGDHPDVAGGLKNLAAVHGELGRAAEAEALSLQALRMYQRLYKGDHQNVALCLNSHAHLRWSLGRSAEAEPLYVQALEMYQRLFQGDHPSVAKSLNDLATVRRDLGRTVEAEPLYVQAIEMYQRLYKADHPNLLTTKGSLAAMYWSQGKLDRSIALFEEVVRAQEAKLGRQHPSTLLNVANLGVNYRDAGRLAEAIPLLEEAYRASKRYPNVRGCGPELLVAYTRAADPAKPGDTDRVMALIQELLGAARSKLPKDSPELAEQLIVICLTLLELKQWAEAEPLIREALTIREAKAPDDWRTFNTKSMLGGALLGQKKLAEAEPLLLDGYRGMKERETTIPPQGMVRIPEALERLVKLYEAKRNEPEATAWRSKLEAAKAEQAKAAAEGGK